MRLMRRHLTTILVAAVAAMATAAGPTTAAAVSQIINADRVDGRDAVGARATKQARAGKLVATNLAGVLPGNIINKARDADRLDGLNSTAFARSAHNHDARYARTNHRHDAAYQKRTARTVVVSVRDSAAASGDGLRAALEGIPTAGAAAPENGARWVVHVGPGTYELDGRLNMRPNTDIVGAGPGATVIRCACGGSNAWGAVVRGAASTALRSLSVENVGSPASTLASAYVLEGNDVATLSDVRLMAEGVGNHSIGIVVDANGSVAATRVDITATSNGFGEPIGIYSDGGASTLRDSTVRGAPALRRPIGPSTLRVANTLVDGAADGVTCVGSFNANFVALGAGCN